MLTQSQVKKLFEYDQLTGNLIWKINLVHHKIKGKTAGCLNAEGYRKVTINKHTYMVHRIIWLWHYGFWPKIGLDHINGDKIDNRINNLREATEAENNQNKRKHQSNNKSGYLGVSPHEKKWQAVITINKKQIYLGLYDDPELAHAAYINKKREVHPFGTL